MTRIFGFKLALGKRPSIAKQKRAIRASGLFDQRWYLSQNSDVRTAGIDPLDHFCRNGDRELRHPCPDFDSHTYLAANLDVKTSGYGPLAHFLFVKEPGIRRARTIAILEKELVTVRAERDAVIAERDAIRLRVYALKASFDRSVREAEIIQKKYAEAMRHSNAYAIKSHHDELCGQR